jgi:tripartite-type tricarboxylate transporter receptor subunit TctC
MNLRAFAVIAGAITLGLSVLDSAVAQFNSSQPVRLILTTAPGGANDAYARLIAEHMAKTLDRIFVVENKPGASGNLGAQLAVNAPADGKLILVATQSLIEINPSTFNNLRWSIDNFMPLIRGVTAPLVLVANPRVPARTLPELVAWIKKNSGKLNYSSYTAGTPSHFLGYQLNERFGLDALHVPSKGTPFQMIDLMAGRVPYGFAQMQASRPLIHDGKLHAIAVTSDVRSRFLQNVPTFAELGYPEFTANIWFGLMIRAGTPPAVVESILNAAKAAHADRDVQSRLEAQGFDVSGQSGPAFAADIERQMKRWARLVKASGFKRD